MGRAVLLFQCNDRKGIVAALTFFIHEFGGNILNSNQHTTDSVGGIFFIRLEFDWQDGSSPNETLEKGIADIADRFDAKWSIRYHGQRLRMAIAVSKFDHCLVDLLYRHRNGELDVEIPCIVSNHEDARPLAEERGIPYHYLPVDSNDPEAQERRFLECIGDRSDFLVMARYMQILRTDFFSEYGKDIINIHHSFLPSFKGANPYRQAYERGVKIIGATAHFATSDLDEGPIITQVVDEVSHRDNVESLKRKGRILEQLALANAVEAYTESRVIRHENKTVVFD